MTISAVVTETSINASVTQLSNSVALTETAINASVSQTPVSANVTTSTISASVTGVAPVSVAVSQTNISASVSGGGSGGVTDHAALSNLDYASAAHTGFQATLTADVDYLTPATAAATYPNVTLGTANGLSLVGQVLSLALASAGTTGALSSADWNTFNSKQSTITFPLAANLGGTGVANLAGSTLTLGAATSITGGGTIALGGYTLTVPATGTAALLATANVFTVPQTIDLAADGIGLTIQGAATQAANLLTIEKSDGTDTAGFDERGILFSNGGGNSQSLYIGNDAGKVTSTSRNTGVGWRTLQSLTTGSGNCAIGASVMRLTTEGANNNGVGDSAFLILSTGSNNNAIGFGACIALTNGSSNNAQGTSALGAMISGSNNVGVGTNAGRYYGTGTSANQTGANSIFIGFNSRANADGDTNQIVIGYEALGNGSNTATLGANSITSTYLKGLIYEDRLTTTNNAVLEVARLQSTVSTASTGSANGFGVGQSFYAETATDGTNQQQAYITSSWVDATNATRKAKLSLSAYDTAARLGLEIEASGTAAKLAFYGGTTVVRGTALTAQLTTITHTAPGTPDYAIQDFVDVSLGAGWAFASHDEANSTLAVIANLQTRVAELEARLGSATGVNLFA